MHVPKQDYGSRFSSESENPKDIDVAIFQNSNEPYIHLSMKFRKYTRSITKKSPLDRIPIKPDAPDSMFLS